MTAPTWFKSLEWSDPIRVEDLREKRSLLPRKSGVYVFTNYSANLEQNFGVLYVGRAGSLFQRVQSYLSDPSKVRIFSKTSEKSEINTSLNHAGKVQLLMKIQQGMHSTPYSGIWVRWHTTGSPHLLEAQLISYLRPAYNTAGLS